MDFQRLKARTSARVRTNHSEENVEDAERRRWDDEEVDGGEVSQVVL